MTIQTPNTLRQLGYAHKIVESLSNMLAAKDDDEFDPVAYELADAIAKRIEHAIDMLNVEIGALSREYEEEELVHFAAKRAKEAAVASAYEKGEPK